DGAQQQLVALSVMARLAETTADSDKAAARAMLVQAQADAADALEDLRDLARGSAPRRCGPNGGWWRRWRPRPAGPRPRSRSKPTDLGVIRRTPRPPSTSAPWKRRRTWPTTP